jgi:hypothetical protein
MIAVPTGHERAFHPQQTVPKTPEPPVSGSGARFAGALLDLLDRALDGRADRSFGSGTMPRSVDTFGARGFFDGSTPPASNGAVSEEGGDQAEASEDDSADVTTTGGVSLSPMSPLIAAGLHEGGPAIVAAADMVPSAESLSGTAVEIAAGVPPTSEQALPASGMMLPPAFRLDDGPVPGLASTAGSSGSRLANAAARTAMKVTLDRDETGVAVTVTADSAIPEGDEALHGAVARLLARHGLVLSELKVTRRPVPGGRQDGSE